MGLNLSFDTRKLIFAKYTLGMICNNLHYFKVVIIYLHRKPWASHHLSLDFGLVQYCSKLAKLCTTSLKTLAILGCFVFLLQLYERQQRDYVFLQQQVQNQDTDNSDRFVTYYFRTGNLYQLLSQRAKYVLLLKSILPGNDSLFTSMIQCIKIVFSSCVWTCAISCRRKQDTNHFS